VLSSGGVEMWAEASMRPRAALISKTIKDMIKLLKVFFDRIRLYDITFPATL
jgi:hypothetical protein